MRSSQVGLLIRIVCLFSAVVMKTANCQNYANRAITNLIQIAIPLEICNIKLNVRVYENKRCTIIELKAVKCDTS